MNYAIPVPENGVWMKEWAEREAEKHGVGAGTIHEWRRRGKYPHVQRVGGPRSTGRRHCFVIVGPGGGS